MAPLSRKERERATRRAAMLDAARAVFAEKGFRTATLDEIAQLAEFGKGTLYNYFEGGKEALLFAILDDVHDDLHDLTARIFAPDDRLSFRDRVRAYVGHVYDYFRDNQDLFIILMKEANRLCFGDDPEKVRYFRSQYERTLNALLPAIEAALASGEIRPLPAESVAHMILGNVDGYVKYSFLDRLVAGDGEAPPVPQRDEVAGFLTDMLFDGMAPRPGGDAASGGDGASPLHDSNTPLSHE